MTRLTLRAHVSCSALLVSVNVADVPGDGGPHHNPAPGAQAPEDEGRELRQWQHGPRQQLQRERDQQSSAGHQLFREVIARQPVSQGEVTRVTVTRTCHIPDFRRAFAL